MTKSKYRVHPVDCNSSVNANVYCKQSEHLPVPLLFQTNIKKGNICGRLNEKDGPFTVGDPNFAIRTEGLAQEINGDTGQIGLQSKPSVSGNSVAAAIEPNCISVGCREQNVEDKTKQHGLLDKASESRAVVLDSKGQDADNSHPIGSPEEKNHKGEEKIETDLYHELSGPPSAKDGGYGWVVLLNVFLLNLVSAGYVKSFGITYTLIMDYFPDAPASSSGLIMGLLIGCRGLLAPAMGALTVIVGPRKCVVTGALLCVAGILLAVPCLSVLYLAVMLGAVVGTGMCLAETPGFILVTDYFQEKRSLANGIRAAGNPTGGVLFAPMVVFLHQEFGLKGTFIMIAGITLQLVVFGMFMRPFELQEKIIQGDYWMKIQRETNISCLQIKDFKTTLDSSQEKKKKKPIDFSFFKNPSYLIYLFMVTCTASALPSAVLYAPVYGRSIGLTDLENSAIASYMSGCDVFMRLLCGFIFNRKNTNKNYGFIACLMIGGIGCMTVPLSTNMWHLMIFATMFSLCMAFFWTLINVLLADEFGGESMSSTWGFFRMLQGVCNFFYPTVIGFLMDTSGGMSVPYIWMGSMLILGSLLFASRPLVAKIPR